MWCAQQLGAYWLKCLRPANRRLCTAPNVCSTDFPAVSKRSLGSLGEICRGAKHHLGNFNTWKKKLGKVQSMDGGV